jgi:hypothetical protein
MEATDKSEDLLEKDKIEYLDWQDSWKNGQFRGSLETIMEAPNSPRIS